MLTAIVCVLDSNNRSLKWLSINISALMEVSCIVSIPKLCDYATKIFQFRSAIHSKHITEIISISMSLHKKKKSPHFDSRRKFTAHKLKSLNRSEAKLFGPILSLSFF